MFPLFGEYECKLDAKGRFLMPATLQKQLPEAWRDEFVINRGLEKCLVLYPIQVWYEELQKIYAKNQHDPKNLAYARLFQQGATPVQLDKQRRILVPKRLARYANLQKQLLLLGMGNRIELWDQETYEQWSQQFSLKELAQEVMQPE